MAALTIDPENALFEDGGGKREPPRQGRRAAAAAADPPPADEVHEGGGAPEGEASPPPPPPMDGGFTNPPPREDEPGISGPSPSPPPPTSKAGWGTDGGGEGGGDLFAGLGEDQQGKFTGVSRRKQAQQEAEPYTYDEDLRKGPDRRKHMEDGDADESGIMEIPELDGEGDEDDITRQVAAPPRPRNNRVQTIKELDHDMQYNIPSNADKEIDLSLLTACLVPSEQVLEEDSLWDPEQLLQQVSQELTSEAESLEHDKEKPEVPERPPNLNPEDKFYT